MAAATIRVGISGWRYAPWRGAFYPADLPQSQELAYAASIFPVIEINGTFYSLQRPTSFGRWYQETPPGFVFSVKGSRFITHLLRLRDVDIPLANFLASGIFELREKLGPVLWQLPPNFAFDAPLLRAFFDLLPFTTADAARLARRHDARLRGRASLAIDADRPMRHALEVRHRSFEDARFVELLREYHIGLVVAESARRWPMLEDVTSDFVYMRLHGDKELYRSGYSGAALERWAQRIRAWHRGEEPEDARRIAPRAERAAGGRDIYCFFDNTDVKLRAPFDARRLMEKLEVHGHPARDARQPPARRPGRRRSAPPGGQPARDG